MTPTNPAHRAPQDGSTDGPDLDNEQVRYYLQLLFARNDARVARVHQEDWLDLTPGSALIGDDRATKPYQLSHAVVGGLSTAIESLDALKSLVVDANTLHPGTPFVLCRVAIESAANAAWMLSPNRRAERVRRRLVLALLDIEDSDKAANEVDLPRRPRTERIADVKALATTANGGEAMNLKDQDSRSATARIREVDNAVDSAAGLFYWMAGSGFAHGRPWASITMLDKADQLELPGGILRRRPVNTLRRLLPAAGAAELFTSHALKLFTLRGARQPDADPTAWLHAYDPQTSARLDE